MTISASSITLGRLQIQGRSPFLVISPVQSFSRVQPTLCNPVDCSTPGFPFYHQLLEFTQTRVHWVSDAIQPSHPLSSPSTPTFNISQHRGLFKWVSFSHQVAKVLEFQLLTFCHKSAVICMSEVIDISSSNLDSSLCFIQPSVSHDVLCI